MHTPSAFDQQNTKQLQLIPKQIEKLSLNWTNEHALLITDKVAFVCHFNNKVKNWLVMQTLSLNINIVMLLLSFVLH